MVEVLSLTGYGPRTRCEATVLNSLPLSDNKSNNVKTISFSSSRKNYPIWKVQCQMALVHDGLCNGMEALLPEEHPDNHMKFFAKGIVP